MSHVCDKDLKPCSRNNYSLMDVRHILDRYKDNKKQQIQRSSVKGSSCLIPNFQRFQRLSLLAKPRETTEQPTSSVVREEDDTDSRGYNINSGHITSLLGRNPERAIDKVISYVCINLINRRCYTRCSRKHWQASTYLLNLLGEIQNEGIKGIGHESRPTRVSHNFKGVYITLKDKFTRPYNSQARLLRLLKIAVYLKGVISGLNISYKVLFSLLKQVAKLVNKKLVKKEEQWLDIDLKLDGRRNGTLLVWNAANLIANVLCSRGLQLPPHVLLNTTLTTWRSFQRNYAKQMFHMIVVMDSLAREDEVRSVVNILKAMLNRSLNDYILRGENNEGTSSNLASMTRHLYHFYGIINSKKLMKPTKNRFLVHRYNIKKILSSFPGGHTMLYSRCNIWYVKWVIMLVTMLLQRETELKHDIWEAIQVMTHFFLSGGVVGGALRCYSPNACLECLCSYIDIVRGLYYILKCFRRTKLYPFHVTLIKALLKNAISKLYATFGSADQYGGARVSNGSGMAGEDGSFNLKAHRTPKSVSYVESVIRKLFAPKIARNAVQINMNHNNFDIYLPYPTYLKLLCAVHNNQSGMKVIFNASKVFKRRGLYHLLEQMAPPSVRNVASEYELRTAVSGRLPLSGFTALLTHIYINNKGMEDCLHELLVNHKLNIMQRTQACHVLSKNSHFMALPLTLPQLLQSLAVDPGDRVWNLILLSMEDPYVRERAPYFTACMVNQSAEQIYSPKAEKLLQLMVGACKSSSESYQALRNIQMHSQLLHLTNDLVNIEQDKRIESLQNGIRLINDTLIKIGSVNLFDDSIEAGKNTEHASDHCPPAPNMVASLDEKTAKVLKSATRTPFMIDFHLDNRTTKCYIYKMDDDMRQDALVVQLKVFMTHVFKTYNLETYLQPFLVVPYSTTLAITAQCHRSIFDAFLQPDSTRSTMSNKPEDRGSLGDASHSTLYVEDDIVAAKGRDYNKVDSRILWPSREVSYTTETSTRKPLHYGRKITTSQGHMLGGIVGYIKGTISRHAMGQSYNKHLDEYFLMKFGPRNSINFKCAMDNFINSLAGYSLLCFLLQVKDRHNGNLLISGEGHIIHIDFGFILGASPAADVTFEYAPFKLTKEMVDLLGGVDSSNFHRYVRLLVCSYLAVRQESEVFISMVKLLQHSGMASFRRSSVQKLKKRFNLDTTPERAANYMIRRIFVALHSKTTKLYDIVQGWQQGIQH